MPRTDQVRLQPGGSGRSPAEATARRLPAGLVAAGIALASSVLVPAACAQDQRLLAHEVPTIGGTLKVSRLEPPGEAKRFEITLGDKPVAEERGYHSVFISAVFPADADARLVLLSLGSGGTGCPAVFKVLEIVRGGKPRITEEFGNCTDVFTTRWEDAGWRIDLPRIGGAPAESWLYRDGELRPVEAEGAKRPASRTK